MSRPPNLINSKISNMRHKLSSRGNIESSNTMTTSSQYDGQRAWRVPLIVMALVGILTTLAAMMGVVECARARDYHYTRTRKHPNHLRISEDLKNSYVEEVKYESKINGTNFEYYRSSLAMNYDELVFETIDKMYRHRLSPFYIHHYDNDQDKKLSSDPQRVSQEACARDLLYLVDKLPLKRGPASTAHFRPLNDPTNPYGQPDDNDHLTPELSAFFDSYARQEAGLLMGNTFWVGAYDQCVNRQIFELMDASEREWSRRAGAAGGASEEAAGGQFARDQHQQAIAFNGRYCVASLKAPIWKRLIEAKKSKARNYFKTERQLRVYSQLFRLQVGICLPDSCDSTALERHRDEIKLLTTTNLADSRFQAYDLVDLYCLPDETSPLRQFSSSAINLIAFLAVWLFIIITATLADVFELFPAPPKAAELEASGKKAAAAAGAAPMAEAAGERPRKRARPSRLPQLVQCLSLRANYRKLMHVSADQERPEKRPPAASDGAPTMRQNAPPTQAAGREEQQVKSVAPASGPKQQEQLREPNLRFLNAFKVLIMFWIINGHIMLLMIQTAKNILNSDALLNELMHFLIGATFGVDLFFTMTGFLTSYLIFKGGHAFRMKPAAWLYLSFHRYWRLAPMYLLSFWFSRSLMQSLGSGPLWDYGTSAITFRGLCNTESWWFPLTLTSNLHGLFEECMITSWYISCDMQFWLVSPIFIHLLAKSPLQGWLVSLLTIAASSKARYDAILNDKSARYDELVQPRADIFMRVSHDLPALYTHPHFRISAYIVGLLAGHYVYMATGGGGGGDGAKRAQKGEKVSGEQATVEGKGNKAITTRAAAVEAAHKDGLVDKGEEAEAKGRTSDSKRDRQQAWRCRPLEGKMRSLCAYLGLFIFLTMALASYLLTHYYPASLLRYARPVAAAAYSVDHLIMALGASLMIVSICQGQWPGLARFLSHPNWTRLSKLNYALLLLQFESIYYQIFFYEQVPLAGTRELINILFNLVVTLYPLAFAATLVFEFPLANLEKLL